MGYVLCGPESDMTKEPGLVITAGAGTVEAGVPGLLGVAAGGVKGAATGGAGAGAGAGAFRTAWLGFAI